MKAKGTLLVAIILIVLMSNSKQEFMGNPGSGLIDLANLFDYKNLNLPKEADFRYNEVNPLTDIGATLGRVLFYDKQLSVNNTISCASCHQQENAFGDFRNVSVGFNGESTLRHSMRLINVDLHADNFKFWDERVRSLENLTTLPIQDTIEMGFSGTHGFPGIDSLINRMKALEYYPILFKEVYGDQEITEQRMANALAQFIRSIVTFDTPFDKGFNENGEEFTDFSNFTEQENRGKKLFFNFPTVDPELEQIKGAGCGKCHKAPSMDISHLTNNNGVIGVAGDSDAIDISIRRAPSLKNILKPDGSPNGPFMHDASLETLDDVINHYNKISFDPRNTMLSGLFIPDLNGDVILGLNDQNIEDLKAFLKTLSGPDVYTNEKWSNPFDSDGNLQVINSETCLVRSEITISICEGESFEGYSTNGIYEDAFISSIGCDSIRLLDLTVQTAQTITENISLCEGEDYNGLSEAGSYVNITTSITGCDSIIYTLEIEKMDCIPSDVKDTKLYPIRIAPNPAHNEIKVNNLDAGNYSVSIIDIDGKKSNKIQQYIDKTNTVNIDNLPSGIYFLTLYNLDHNKTYTGKFVKM